MNLHDTLLTILTIGLGPAVLAQSPPNDACSTAIPITCGETITGNTTEATDDIEAFNCFTSVQAAGVWYSIQGDGQAITLSTCANTFYDTKINVYTGACPELVCVAGNDDGGDCGTGSTVSWPALEGTTYLILVQGYQGAVGEFEMSVSCGPLSYDFCQGATPIDCNQSLSGSTIGATPDAAEDCVTGIQAPGVWYTFTGISDPVIMSTCESFDYDTRINVYAGACDGLVCVTGNDDTPGVGLCSTVNFVPDPATQYYVLVQGYDGEVGDFMLELVCQTCGNPTDVSSSASDASAFISWQSLNPGATYIIEYGPLGFVPGTGQTVTGTVVDATMVAEITGLDAGTEYAFYLQEECGPGDVSTNVGAFTFTTLAEPPPANAVCAGALPIDCGTDVEGDTGLSFFLAGLTCGAANITAPGLWYTFTGTGETVTLSTCNTASFDTKISVYSGSCSDLACVAGGDDATGCADNSSEVVFPTTDGTSYLVLVHGYGADAGTFTLSMSCEPACSPVAANDECVNAITIEPAGLGLCDPIQGTNVCAFATGVANPPCDPFAPIVDVWYVFDTGDMSTHTIFIGALAAGDMSAAVYTDCGSLTYLDCETGIDGPWQLNNLEPNTLHYLRVWNGGGADAGTFAVCIETDLTTDVPDARLHDGVRLWPNPANDRLQIDGAAADRMAVIDLQGRVVLTTATNRAALVTLDIAALAPGSYLVRSLDDGGRTLGRFTKE